jgi:hypothetical protein
MNRTRNPNTQSSFEAETDNDNDADTDADTRRSHSEGLLVGTLALMSAYRKTQCSHMVLKIVRNLGALADHPDFSHEFHCICDRLYSDWRHDIPPELDEFAQRSLLTNLTHH